MNNTLLSKDKNNYQLTDEHKRRIAFHEVGHMFMYYWLRGELSGTHAQIHQDRSCGSFHGVLFDISEWDLMRLIGGPMAEFLSCDILATKPLLFRNEYSIPDSDSSRIKLLVEKLRGRYDRRYHLLIQDRCLVIMLDGWDAIEEAAGILSEKKKVSGHRIQRIFRSAGIRTLNDDPDKWPVIQWRGNPITRLHRQ